ncbi:DUF2169 family type VI secretion system accessory protein [Pseudomonas syringae]|uniref:DUF2169 domain-containing protein n=1 Tax=Pseudomonas syringae TaxID=317 RepID=A0A085VGE6_PSESX|nr:pentapeptide repeat-containing protein [Pseudomonas syringae]KFE54509.1 hypothetical protein IV01_15470 [Pseudomonas syringae]
MKNYKLDESSLLLIARHQSLSSKYLVVTVGFLVNLQTGKTVPAKDSWDWICARFSGAAFDRGLKKSCGTFAVHGQAFALNEQQRTAMPVHVRVGSCEKTLHAFAPRTWRYGLSGWNAVSSGGLESVALDFQHAFGGEGYADNLEGVGYVENPGPLQQIALPQVEHPDAPLRSPMDRPAPASFLPMPPQCMARKGFMGRLDESWQMQTAPWLPADTDPRWFNEVAEDQCQAHYWRGDESWSVSGMHPLHPQLKGNLPGLRARLFVERVESSSPIVEQPLDLDTVWLFPNDEHLLLIYRAQIPVNEVDAEDIAALGVACEHRDDPTLSPQAWIDRLWAQETVEPLMVPALEIPTFDQEQMLRDLQAQADQIHAQVLTAHQEGIQAAQKLATDIGKPFDASRFPPPERVNFAEAIAQRNVASVIAEAPFDPAVLEANIRAAIVDSERQAHRYVEQVARHLDRTAESIYAQAAELKAANPAPSFNAGSMLAKLPLSAASKAEYQARIEDVLSQAASVQSNIGAEITALTEQIVAATALLPASGLVVAKVDWTRELIEASCAASQALENQKFTGLDLSGIDLSGARLMGSVFEKCKLTGSVLTAADIHQGVFIDCDLAQAAVHEGQLSSAFFQGCCLDDANLSGAHLAQAYASDCSFLRAQFTAAVVPQAQFVDCALDHADFTRAELAGASFHTCTLTAVSAVDADLSKSSLHACVVDGLQMSGANLQEASWSQVTGTAVNAKAAQATNFRLDQSCQLPGICLDDAQLQRASFQGVNLRGASLKGTMLKQALISRCDLRDSDGYHLNAVQADFTGSDLRQVRWRGANLMEAWLRKVQLDAADLTGSNLFGAMTEAVQGTGVVLDRALLGRCRLKEDLAHV